MHFPKVGKLFTSEKKLQFININGKYLTYKICMMNKGRISDIYKFYDDTALHSIFKERLDGVNGRTGYLILMQIYTFQRMDINQTDIGKNCLLIDRY